MALVTKRIYRISGNHSALNAQQIGVESSADADLGFKMYGGKDDAGAITKFLAKGKPGIMSTLNLSGGSTTGDAGLLKHDTLGDITGGQMTVSEFNTYISDGGFLWTRDVPNTRLEPLTTSDKIVVGDGAAATPGVSHESNPTSGMYYGDVGHSINGIGLAHGGVGMIGVGVETGTAVMVCDPTQLGFEIRHQRDNSTGANEMKIHNVSTQNGVTSSLTIEASAVTAVSEIVLNAQNLEFNADSAIDITALLGTITIQAQGTTLGGVIIESDWFEFQNYTAYSPIPVWNSNTQWAAYEAEFGTEYPILQAIVDNAAGGGVSAPDGLILFGNAAGTGVTTDSKLKWENTYNTLELDKSSSTTNWYDTNGQIIRLLGNATQGTNIVGTEDTLVLGLYNSAASGSVDANLNVIGRVSVGGANVTTTLEALNYGTGGEGSNDADALVYAYSTEDDATATIKATVESTADTASVLLKANDGTNEASLSLYRTGAVGRVDLAFVDILDIDGAEIREIGSTNYSLYTITVTTGAFTIDPDDGADQTATIVTNSTFNLTEPSNNASKIVVKIYNSDTSDHTVSVINNPGFEGKINWVGSFADGFTVPAGERVLLGIFFDQTNEWFIAGAACELVDYVGS